MGCATLQSARAFALITSVCILIKPNTGCSRFSNPQWTRFIDPAGHAAIPSGTRTIPAQAFRDCTRLRSVAFNAELEGLGYRAFYRSGLQGTINLANTRLTSLGSSAFTHCDYVVMVRLPLTVTAIPSNCFFNCDQLRLVIGTGNVRTVAHAAFGNTALHSIDLSSLEADGAAANAFTNTGCAATAFVQPGVCECAPCAETTAIPPSSVSPITTTSTPSPTPPPTTSPTPLPTTSPTPLPTTSPTPLPTTSPTAPPTTSPASPPTPTPSTHPTPAPTPAPISTTRPTPSTAGPTTATATVTVILATSRPATGASPTVAVTSSPTVRWSRPLTSLAPTEGPVVPDSPEQSVSGGGSGDVDWMLVSVVVVVMLLVLLAMPIAVVLGRKKCNQKRTEKVPATGRAVANPLYAGASTSFRFGPPTSTANPRLKVAATADSKKNLSLPDVTSGIAHQTTGGQSAPDEEVDC